jgi:5'-deoxynucleotidase YfbR-like HD superfamily hydrolase
MTWISTLSGRKIDFIHPDPGQIDIEDIAAGLAAMPRWCGQTVFAGKPVHYSVAQHSVYCSRMCPTHGLAALLHDAAEAYMGDCPRPLKDFLRQAWADVEGRLLATIFKKFGLDPFIPPAVKAIDDRLLMTERRDLQPHCPPWDWHGPDPFTWNIAPVAPSQARAMFLKRFTDLMLLEGRVA